MNILIVHHDPAVLHNLGCLLLEVGHRPSTAVGHMPAIRTIDAGNVDLVMCGHEGDGQVSGLDLAKVVAERRPGLAVIIMTDQPVEPPLPSHVRVLPYPLTPEEIRSVAAV
ncbi:MAG: Hybrid sensor histidine kinase [Candidatus Yanofskybacteria bacterium GW2011_GWA1_48_10]|uniref:Hybrid sensor histidine kinase n=2 Tax=Candidatus Yanofskyibacteriota TaxID=1752733 RepID=A0A0G1U7E3_9BACT|nr:MAG: Hybrid sensor histidine kinase [Candidatus Yanofskybacteria bacterium GW2011_GWA1_48_10]OGN05989.1 MAG: hypothetical protein A2669_01315 [Candidatus Yanofskybacteria bacterium RIFCSPHIGHO2_01_FULL_48_25b]